MPTVVRNTPRTDPELLGGLAYAGAATVHEAQGRIGLLRQSLRPPEMRGAVMEASVRDVASLTEMGFPVWSKTISAQGTVKETRGNVQTPIIRGRLAEKGLRYIDYADSP